jgi:hypothetical protein
MSVFQNILDKVNPFKQQSLVSPLPGNETQVLQSGLINPLAYDQPQNATVPEVYTQQNNYSPHVGDAPPDIAQILKEIFDPINEATNAAQVLKHPRSQTYSPQEVERMGAESWNLGENPWFRTGLLQVPNYDKNKNITSYDYGLMRNNNKTFDDLKSRAYWAKQLAEKNINNIEDTEDTRKSMELAKITGDQEVMEGRERWRPWYAATLELRY